MKKVAIIGAGPAGVEAASIISNNGYDVDLFEKSANTMKNLHDKAFLFPNFVAADDIINILDKKLLNKNIATHYDTEIMDIQQEEGNSWKLIDQKNQSFYADAVLISTGYTVFDAHRKEELGYGIYKGIHTSLEMEKMIRHDQIVNSIGEKPKRIAFLQCVGSRDEKSGNHYCSKVCCVTAVKQAIEARRRLPDTEIYIFYMDLRMWVQHFEEMYRSAQQDYNIRFVRGRISEASSTFDGRVQIKAEDTLMGLPMKMTTDLLILMVGMEASEGTKRLAKACNICGEYGFASSVEPHLDDNFSGVPGIFVAGTCKRPMSLNDSILDARSAAIVISDFLK